MPFAVGAAVMRVLLSEQSFGAFGLLSAVGMGNDQLILYQGVITLATIAGLAVGLMTLNPLALLRPVLISCALIAVGSFMDADASNLTRPANLFLSQALIPFAPLTFIGPTMMAGMLRAIVNGPSHVESGRAPGRARVCT